MILEWAVVESLWRAALWDSPYAQGRGPCIFYDLCPRSFPSPVCDFVGDVPEDIPEGVPLRAEGFPKRRC